jgi:trehalose-phosphatase
MTTTTLLAFDFDGTLAPICQDPGAVRIRRAAATLLAHASQLRGVAVAVISGRDADDLAARTNASGAYLVASHGLEIRAPGGVLIRDSPPLRIDLDADLLREIEMSGLRLEEKKHGVALHWRGVPYDAIAPVVEQFRRWAETAELQVIEGRCVVEARRPGGDKEAALRWLTRAVGATRVVYAGDDLTDFAALRFALENGRALFLASAERAAPPGVTVVKSFRELFRLVREEVMG